MKVMNKAAMAASVEQTTDEATMPTTFVPSPWRIMWREIYSDKLALVSLFMFIFIITTSFVWAAQIDQDTINRVNLMQRNLPPGGDFILGTDSGGRDVVPQLVVGARNSFVIAFIVALTASLIGILVGLFSGYYGGHVDNVIMRIIDFFTMTPTLMVTIVLVIILPRTPFFLGFTLIIFSWIGMARMIRMRTLQQGIMDYVQASKTLGTPNIIIIFREVLPNIVSFMVVNLTLLIAGTMGIETGLTFLGFGLPFGTPSLGTMVANAADPLTMQNRPWQWLPAALLILVMMLCINYVGQALNRAADARRRRV